MKKETIGKIQVIIGILILLSGIYLSALNYDLRYIKKINIKDSLPENQKSDLFKQYVVAWNEFQRSDTFKNVSADTKTIMKVDFANTLFLSMESYYSEITMRIYIGLIIAVLGLLIILQGFSNIAKDIEIIKKLETKKK
jgi:hypothetical protein